ncbi:hypothetical protein Naga_100177g6 [Nannochloropsis gaditana]|uniref:Uncharacterized protein n=1 Tax=Nannochloropsis gaditana TaxID=72520 RepID=W7TR64_9STRA|nr:hypothetical protein Naga_100177g6 [Nannochloropsis gaditana]
MPQRGMKRDRKLGKTLCNASRAALSSMLSLSTASLSLPTGTSAILLPSSSPISSSTWLTTDSASSSTPSPSNCNIKIVDRRLKSRIDVVTSCTLKDASCIMNLSFATCIEIFYIFNKELEFKCPDTDIKSALLK